MFCSNCGHNLAGSQGAFCPNCGAKTSTDVQAAPAALPQSQPNPREARTPSGSVSKKTVTSICIALLVIIIGIFAFRNFGGSGLVGEWESVDITYTNRGYRSYIIDTLEFLPNGMVSGRMLHTINDPMFRDETYNSPRTTWQAENGVLTLGSSITLGIIRIETLSTYTISGSTLTIEDNRGRITTFTRR